ISRTGQPMPAFCVRPNRSPLGQSRSISAESGSEPLGPAALVCTSNSAASLLSRISPNAKRGDCDTAIASVSVGTKRSPALIVPGCASSAMGRLPLAGRPLHAAGADRKAEPAVGHHALGELQPGEARIAGLLGFEQAQ